LKSISSDLSEDLSNLSGDNVSVSDVFLMTAVLVYPDELSASVHFCA